MTNREEIDSSLPDRLRPFFWDVEFEKLHTTESADFIISRLMEHGDEAAVRFLLSRYDVEKLREVLARSRSCSRRSRQFWRILLDGTNETCIPRLSPNLH